MDDARVMTTVGVLLDVEIEAPVEAAGDTASGPVHEVLPSGFGPSTSSPPKTRGPTITEIMDIDEVNPVTKKGPTITELPDDTAPPTKEESRAGAKPSGPATASSGSPAGKAKQPQEAAPVPKTANELKVDAVWSVHDKSPGCSFSPETCLHPHPAACSVDVTDWCMSVQSLHGIPHR